MFILTLVFSLVAMVVNACAPAATPTATEAPPEVATPTPVPPTPTEAEPIRIGVAQALTGKYTRTGEYELIAFKLWVKNANEAGGLLGKLADRRRGKAPSFAALQLFFALFLPLCLYAAYTSRNIVGAIPGEGVGLIPIFYSSFLILTPLALVDGAMFAFGCRAYACLTGDEAPSTGWVYVYEAL